MVFLECKVGEGAVRMAMMTYYAVVYPIEEDILDFIRFLGVDGVVFRVGTVEDSIVTRTTRRPVLSGTSFTTFGPGCKSVAATFD